MTTKQQNIISLVSLVLGMFGFLCMICFAQGILPFDRQPVRIGTTVLLPADQPINNEISEVKPVELPEIVEPRRKIALSLPEVSAPEIRAQELPKVVKVEQSSLESFAGIRPGAARKRQAITKRALKVPGGAAWVSDVTLSYDPMNGKL